MGPVVPKYKGDKTQTLLDYMRDDDFWSKTQQKLEGDPALYAKVQPHLESPQMKVHEFIDFSCGEDAYE